MNNKSIIPASDEIWSILKEVSTIQRENRKELKEVFAIQKESNKELKETRKLFETQWGKLVESLIEGKLVELLKARGIAVRHTSQRIEVCYKKANDSMQRREFDIIAVNGEEVVVVEVKTTLTPDKTKYFLESLKDFKKYFPDYKSKTVYGAVAYLKSESEAHLFSQRQGLFVIRATGDSASIINEKNFTPKAFS